MKQRNLSVIESVFLNTNRKSISEWEFRQKTQIIHIRQQTKMLRKVQKRGNMLG